MEQVYAAERDVRWDLLRSLAMFAVVVVHAAARIGTCGGPDVSAGVSTFFLVCDPVFFALSGYFAIRPLKGSLRQYYLGKLVTIVLPVLLYSVIAYLVAARLQALSFGGWLAYFEYLLAGAWWFVPALVPMLVVAPFLYRMFEALDDAALVLFVKMLLALVCWGVACDAMASIATAGPAWVQSLSGVMGRLLPAGSQLFCGYSLYFCMGYFMRRLAPKVGEGKRHAIIAVGLVCLVIDALAAQFGLTRSNPSYLWAFATPAVFVLFSRAKVTGAGARRLVKWTSRRSYSIYLFQAAAVLVVGQAIYDNALFGDLSAMGELGRVLVWLAFAFASYLLSWTAASVLDTVLLKPAQRLMRRILACL